MRDRTKRLPPGEKIGQSFSRKKAEFDANGVRKDATPPKTAALFREYIALDPVLDLKKRLRLEAQILANNLGLVSKVVKRFTAQWDLKTIPQEDLEQAGAMGLLRAIRVYDPSRASFSTCAGLWILPYLQTCAIREGFNVKGRTVGADVFKRMRKFRLLQGREPTAEELGIPQKLYDAIHSPQTFTVPLETTAGAGEGEEGYDLDANFGGLGEDPETMAYLQEIYRAIPPEHSEIFEAAFLWGMTDNQIARDLKIKVDVVTRTRTELLTMLRRDFGDQPETSDPGT